MMTLFSRLPLMLTAIMLAFIIGQQTNNAGRILAEPPKPDSRLKQLLKDRVDAKKSMVETLTRLKVLNAASFHEIPMARIELLRAELDLLDTKAERVGVLEQIRDVRKEFLQELHRRRGCGPLTEIIQAEIALIEADIELEREKLKP